MSLAGITLDKLLIIAILAAVLIGPERLPALAEKLGALVRGLRDLAGGAKERMREEMGPEFDDPAPVSPGDFQAAASASAVATVTSLPRRHSGPMRFDDEAT